MKTSCTSAASTDAPRNLLSTQSGRASRSGDGQGLQNLLRTRVNAVRRLRFPCSAEHRFFFSNQRLKTFWIARCGSIFVFCSPVKERTQDIEEKNQELHEILGSKKLQLQAQEFLEKFEMSWV